MSHKVINLSDHVVANYSRPKNFTELEGTHLEVLCWLGHVTHLAHCIVGESGDDVLALLVDIGDILNSQDDDTEYFVVMVAKPTMHGVFWYAIRYYAYSEIEELELLLKEHSKKVIKTAVSNWYGVPLSDVF